MSAKALVLFTLAAAVSCGVISSRGDEKVATIDLSVKRGPSEYVASGFLNGIPANPGQIPLHFFEDIKFRTARSSGSYVMPNGWLEGKEGFKARWDAAVVNYNVIKELGGLISIPIHGMWGAPYASRLPGDNGDWSDLDEFLETFTSHMNEYGWNVPGTPVVTEIWNEPDQERYWNGTQEQYFNFWGRAFHKMREAIPHIEIMGPTIQAAPTVDDEWHTGWAAFVLGNDSVPDHYTYEAQDEPNTSLFLEHAAEMRKATGLPNRPIFFNEYGPLWERQNPSGDVFKISQLERVNVRGLRSNWGRKDTLAIHDLMDGLVGKPNANTTAYNHSEAGYWPTAEFQVYKYYAQNMTGERVKTVSTADSAFDVYATLEDGGSTLKFISGASNGTGFFDVKVMGLESLGLSSSGQVKAKVWEFPGTGDHYAPVYDIVDLGTTSITYADGVIKIPIDQSDWYSTKAFEIQLKA